MQHLVTEEIDYKERLREHIKSLLSSSQAYSFEEIVRQCKGAYPLTILEIVNELGFDYNTKKSSSINSKASAIEISNSLLNVLADAHPADYDWRFTPDTIQILTELISTKVGKNEVIALFGTTTLFPPLIGKGYQTILFNKSASLIEDLKTAGYNSGLFKYDLFYPLPANLPQASLVIADPPWYNDFYEAFIFRANEMLKEDGVLLLSVLPEFTRPSALSDRMHISRFAEACGFELIEVIPEKLYYESPKFEIQALEVKAIDCGVWRPGDLFIYRKVKSLPGEIHVSRPSDEPDWIEFRIKRKKIKLRKRQTLSHASFDFGAVDITPVLSTVSRRSPLRDLIDFWTSDNIAYSVTRIDILRDAMTLLENNDNIEEIVSNIALRYKLSKIESDRLGFLLGETF